MKLNSEAAKQAWADYKEFMEGMGHRLDGARGIEQAFKYAFAAGQAHKEEAATAVSSYHEAPKDLVKTFVEKAKKVDPVDKIPYAEFKKGADVSKLHPEVAEKLQTKTGIKRPKQGPVIRRSPKERQTHARLVASILQSAGKPMQLQEIIQLVNASGANWYPKSGSGHMLDAMEHQPCIKKVGYGHYEYQQ
jgi:hypothetical protein